MKIEQAPHNFFDSKEEYLTFRQAWKDFHKEGKHKPVPHDDYYGGTRYVSDLMCVHHLIYALLRGRDIRKMFVPNNSIQGADPYLAYYAARNQLSFAANMLVNLGDGKRMLLLLQPFGECIDSHTIISLLAITKEWQFE